MILASLPIYKRFSGQRSHNMATKVLSYVHADSKVLDFGCGNCYTAKEILIKNPTLHITAIDVIRDQNLDELTKNLQFIQYDAGALPFEDNSFDAAMAISSMHHTADPEFYLSEMKRVVKPEGSIILIEEMYIHLLDKVWISAQDWILNKMKKGVPVPLTFRSRKHYIKQFDIQGLEVQHQSHIRPGFPWMHHYVFHLRVRK